MAAFEVTATQPVAASQQAVWNLLCDTSRYAEYVVATDEVTRTDGPAKPGSTYDEINPIAGPWKGKSHWEVTQFDAPHKQVHVGTGIAPTVKQLVLTMSVTPAGDDACEVTFHMAGESALGPFGAAMFAVLKGQVEKDNRKTLENFAALAAR